MSPDSNRGRDLVDKAITDRLLATPFASKLTLELVGSKHGEVTLAMAFAPDLVTVGDTVHGGALATLADVAAVSAAVATADALPNWAATSTLSLAYSAPVRGSRAVATARCLRSGSRQSVLTVSIHDETGQHCVEAMATVILGQ